MSRALAAWRRALPAAALAIAALAPGARGQAAPADTTIEGYVRSMADSTDAYFGLSAQPADTTGLDSVRVWALAHPRALLRRRGHHVAFAPEGAFNRALGPVNGAEVSTGSSIGLGRIAADAQWASGADLWLGGGRWQKRWGGRSNDEEERRWRLELWGGRASASMDRDFFDPVQSSLRAFIAGTDRSNYLRRDGVELQLSHRSRALWGGLVARDERESPLPTTASWYLGGHGPVVFHNDTASAGRVHELGAWAGVRVPHLPLTLEARGQGAGGSLGGDLAYTRVRVSAGGAIGLGRHLALAPEADWGRLKGSALPQDAFYLGGGTLRTLVPGSLRGTGRAAAHVDLMLTDAVQTLLGLARQPTFPIQLGVFAGSAALWGFDPASGRPRLDPHDWMGRQAWLSEAGVSVLYRPGLPSPDSFVRIDWATPIGPDGRSPRFYLSYARALGFLAGR